MLAAAVALAAVVSLFAIVASSASSANGSTSTKPTSTKPTSAKPTIVLVHGAWADASSWNAVVERLQADGYPVIAPANPLRSLSGDSAYIASVLAQTPGPIVLVGHSYGGAVITNAAAGNSNVKALVYVDAFIPDIGESVNSLVGAGSQIPESIEFKGYPPFGPTDVDVYLKPDMFRSTFAGDLSPKQTAVMAAEQRPLGAAAASEPTTAAAWKTIPSWALIGLDDKAIPPAQQLFMAKRAGSTIVEIHSSHVAMISHPGAVTKLIESAARATS
jgi:pimeloyl-ACP methyl ester carboxylesterase